VSHMHMRYFVKLTLLVTSIAEPSMVWRRRFRTLQDRPDPEATFRFSNSHCPSAHTKMNRQGSSCTPSGNATVRKKVPSSPAGNATVRYTARAAGNTSHKPLELMQFHSANRIRRSAQHLHQIFVASISHRWAWPQNGHLFEDLSTAPRKSFEVRCQPPSRLLVCHRR